MKTLRTALTIGAITLASLAGCKEKEKPEITPDAIVSTSDSSIVDMINQYHGGINAARHDVDYDGDGKGDFSLISKDGVIFYSPSKNGIYPNSISVWYKVKSTDIRFNKN